MSVDLLLSGVGVLNVHRCSSADRAISGRAGRADGRTGRSARLFLRWRFTTGVGRPADGPHTRRPRATTATQTTPTGSSTPAQRPTLHQELNCALYGYYWTTVAANEQNRRFHLTERCSDATTVIVEASRRLICAFALYVHSY
jgi:hypothetical protein